MYECCKRMYVTLALSLAPQRVDRMKMQPDMKEIGDMTRAQASYLEAG